MTGTTPAACSHSISTSTAIDITTPVLYSVYPAVCFSTRRSSSPPAPLCLLGLLQSVFTTKLSFLNPCCLNTDTWDTWMVPEHLKSICTPGRFWNTWIITGHWYIWHLDRGKDLRLCLLHYLRATNCSDKPARGLIMSDSVGVVFPEWQKSCRCKLLWTEFGMRLYILTYGQLWDMCVCYCLY